MPGVGWTTDSGGEEGVEIGMKVRIKNFQALANVEVEAVGLTVITGRSNIGKSCFIRAVSAAIFGWPGDHYIRDGTEHCGVVIEDGAERVVWRKVKKATLTKQTALQVGSKVHTKLGRDHAALTAELGIVELTTSTSRQRPQIARQHDPVFLLTESETTVAEVFKMLGRVDVITTAQTMSGKDRRAAVNERQVREKDREALEVEIAEIPDLEELRKQLGSCKQTTLLCEAAAEEKRVLREKMERYESLMKENTIPDMPVEVGIPPQMGLLKQVRELWDWVVEEGKSAAQLVTVENTITRIQDYLGEVEKQLEVCPTCGRAFE